MHGLGIVCTLVAIMSKPTTQQFRVKETRETITISFERFMCLRAIAEAVRVGDTSRQATKLRELQSLEVKDWMKLLEPEYACYDNNRSSHVCN